MKRTAETILILDVGTTNCKAHFYDLHGNVIASGRASYPEFYPKAGWVEQEPGDWWRAVKESVAEALASSQVSLPKILGVGLSGQMHGVVALGQDGRALTSCLTLRDSRALREADEIIESLSMQAIYQITGARMGAYSPLAKIRWMQKNQPELYQQTSLFLPVKDYIRYLLSGEAATEVIDAAGTLLYDLRRGGWSEEILKAAQIDVERLPEIRPGWAQCGGLRRDAAQELGLPEGLPIFVGAGDDIEFLGYGVAAAGDALEHLGTTGSIMACIDRAVEDPDQILELYPHIQDDLWLLGGSVNSAGSTIRWAEGVLQVSGGAEALLAEFEHEVAALSDPLVFLPYLAGERCPIWNPQARGGWLGLSLSHERKDLAISALRGVLFSLKHVVEKIEGMSVPITSLAVQESSPAMLRQKANIYARPLRLVGQQDATSLGAMMLVGMGAGLFSDLKAALAQVYRGAQHIQPDPQVEEQYDRLFQLYQEVSAAVTPILSRFSAGFPEK